MVAEADDPKPWEKKKRKGPRLVELAEGQVLSKKEFLDVADHAKNSAIWYVTNRPKSAQQIREKLYAKGYPEGEVILEADEGRVKRNIVEETITHLENVLLLDDRFFAERIAESRLRQKQGKGRVRFALIQKGIPAELADEVLEEVYADSGDELLEFVQKAWEQELRRTPEEFKVLQKVMRKAMSRGWGYEEVSDAIERHRNPDEDE